MLTNLDDAPRAQSSFRYGTLQCGADTWDSALGRGRRVFSCDSRLKSDIPLHLTNYYRTNWANYPPLDLFVVMDNGMNNLHDSWMRDWGNLSRSKYLLVFAVKSVRNFWEVAVDEQGVSDFLEVQ